MMKPSFSFSDKQRFDLRTQLLRAASHQIQMEEDNAILQTLKLWAKEVMPQIIGIFKHPYEKKCFFELSFLNDHDYANPNIPIRFRLMKFRKVYSNGQPTRCTAKDYILEIEGNKGSIIESGKKIEFPNSDADIHLMIFKGCKRTLQRYARKAL